MDVLDNYNLSEDKKAEIRKIIEELDFPATEDEEQQDWLDAIEWGLGVLGDEENITEEEQEEYAV